MTLDERVKYFEELFFDLQSTNSIVDKNYYISKIPAELKEDFVYIVECLTGKYKFGFTMGYKYLDKFTVMIYKDVSIKDVLEDLQTPIKNHDLTDCTITHFVTKWQDYFDFLEPIVNRTLKLGIGKSLLDKTILSPMLAKKFEGTIDYDYLGYYITEKLDGNRCIAHYEEDGWHFTSRNGKEMKVNFDMSNLSKDYVYDGEVLSPEQVKLSEAIYNKTNIENEGDFNSTSGLINSKAEHKNLIYNIFDVIDPNYSDWNYQNRRKFLDALPRYVSNDVRILPILKYYNHCDDFKQDIIELLDYVTSKGGEGLMINLGGKKYEHKRTNVLLKFKKVQTMDMRVVDILWGTGKYEGMIGSLYCEAVTDDGKLIHCNVGSGLDDGQRYTWALNKSQIIGKIVEVAYFNISQDVSSKNTNEYSLRFPRLKQVRLDKNETSEY